MFEGTFYDVDQLDDDLNSLMVVFICQVLVNEAKIEKADVVMVVQRVDLPEMELVEGRQ